MERASTQLQEPDGSPITVCGGEAREPVSSRNGRILRGGEGTLRSLSTPMEWRVSTAPCKWWRATWWGRSISRRIPSRGERQYASCLRGSQMSPRCERVPDPLNGCLCQSAPSNRNLRSQSLGRVSGLQCTAAKEVPECLPRASILTTQSRALPRMRGRDDSRETC